MTEQKTITERLKRFVEMQNKRKELLAHEIEALMNSRKELVKYAIEIVKTTLETKLSDENWKLVEQIVLLEMNEEDSRAAVQHMVYRPTLEELARSIMERIKKEVVKNE